MSLKLPPNLASLLREIVSSRRPDLARLLSASEPLHANDRQELRCALADELSSTGLTDDDEPNERGKLIEELIDRLGQL